MAISDLEIIISAFSNYLMFDVANQSDFSACNQALLGFDKPYIPNEYAEFLSLISNGFSLDGMWLFGTIEQENNQNNHVYFIPSLITIAEQFSDFSFVEKYLFIGQFFGLMIAYNYETDGYEIINTQTFQTVDNYKMFEDMFYALIMKRTENENIENT
ncbi:MAG: hypothetical protein LBU68_00470 [Rickettsiales bacterium]|nr:hypothetical protein [Rickettsiales bacterium]